MRGLRRLRCLVVALSTAVTACADTPLGAGKPEPKDSTITVYQPGSIYVGRAGYIEYLAGSLPILITAPHGGSLLPAEIPDRTAANCPSGFVILRDTNTEELARAIREAFFAKYGKYPHVVINKLHRRKLDANRDAQEAACGDAEAITAWNEFHIFATSAKNRILADHGRGWYTDLHGHGHAINRLELGYLLETTDLRLTDAALDANVAYENESSIRTFSAQSPRSFSRILRGAESLGTLFAAEGVPAVPSSAMPAPLGNEEYFTGGYNTDRYGCAAGGNLCGVQIESHFSGVRDLPENRARFAAILVRVYETYLDANFSLRVR